MKFEVLQTADIEAASEVVRLSFTNSEGESEGQVVSDLARALLETCAAQDVFGFVARNPEGQIAGVIVFSRLWFDGDARQGLLLGPVAIAPGCQRQGIGRGLIGYGLEQVSGLGHDMVAVYGDPNYYGKLGFKPVNTEQVPAPFPLSFPHGWQAMSFEQGTFEPLTGPARCVAPFAKPDYW